MVSNPASDQLLPLSFERNTPLYGAAKINGDDELSLITANACTSRSPTSLADIQIAPLSDERKTPLPKVPTKSTGEDEFPPIDANDVIALLVSPLSAFAQLVPLFIERETPLALVPANTIGDESDPTTAKAVTSTVIGKRLLALDQVAPESDERKIPPESPTRFPAVPAKSTGHGEFSPLTASAVISEFAGSPLLACQLVPLLVVRKKPPR